MSFALILAVSHDPMILATRSSVLRSADYLVEAVESVPQAINKFLNGDFDLVLMCHTVPLLERDRLCRAIRTTGSCTPILLVSSLSESHGLADKVVHSHPEKMLQDIEAALRQAKTLFGSNVVPIQSERVCRIPRATVLCIDDDNESLQIRRMVLERSGFHVLTSLNCQDGLTIFSTGVADAVVLDYAMPDMDGGTAAARMRKMRPDAPLILYSGFSNVPDEVIAQFDLFIPKGTSPHVLIKALQEFLADHDDKKPPGKAAGITSIEVKHRKAL